MLSIRIRQWLPYVGQIKKMWTEIWVLITAMSRGKASEVVKLSTETRLGVCCSHGIFDLFTSKHRRLTSFGPSQVDMRSRPGWRGNKASPMGADRTGLTCPVVLYCCIVVVVGSNNRCLLLLQLLLLGALTIISGNAMEYINIVMTWRHWRHYVQYGSHALATESQFSLPLYRCC